MKRILILLIGLSFPGYALAEPGIVQSPAYKECIALSNSNPLMALGKAEEWLAVDNGIASHHCHAMALYGLKRYAEAGEELNNLRFTIPEDNLLLRVFVTRQAVAAWTSANRPDAALAVLDIQISEMNQVRGNNATAAKLVADLFLDRARLNITYGKMPIAIQDLDHAVSLIPLNTEVLVERAQTFEKMGDHALARMDAESVLRLEPSNLKARNLLARIDKPPVK